MSDSYASQMVIALSGGKSAQFPWVNFTFLPQPHTVIYCQVFNTWWKCCRAREMRYVPIFNVSSPKFGVKFTKKRTGILRIKTWISGMAKMQSLAVPTFVSNTLGQFRMEFLWVQNLAVLNHLMFHDFTSLAVYSIVSRSLRRLQVVILAHRHSSAD